MHRYEWRDQLQRAAEHISQAVIGVDVSGRVIYANPAVETCLKLKRSDIIGQRCGDPILRLALPDGEPLPDEMNPCLKAIKTGQAIFDEKVLFTCPSGEQVILSINAMPHHDVAGEVVGVVAALIDVTERERAQEALRNAEERFRLLAENAQDLIYRYRLAPTPGFEYVSPSATAITGYTPEEHYADPNLGFKLVHPDDRSILEGIVKHPTREPVVLRWIRKDGAVIWTEQRNTPIYDEAGTLIAIEGIARDVTQREVSNQLSDALSDINASITSTLDIDEILQSVVVEAAAAIGAETAFISLNKRDYWVISYGYGFPKELIGARTSLKNLPFTSLVVEAKETIAINDAFSDSRVDTEAMRQKGVRSIMSVPFIIRGEVIGVLVFLYSSKPKVFTDIEVDFANKLAASVALALENARLYEAERHIADTLQESLLVMPEEVAGIEFGALYRSATDAARVGGDFYDLFELESGRIGILIGDVSGKGLEATALTGVVKNTIKAHAFEDSTPAMVLSKTNDLVAKISAPSEFVTVFFGILDRETGKLAFCSAGHPPPLVLRASGAVELLTKHSPIIGAFPGVHYRSDKTTLGMADTLILYTDGVIEARCREGFYGEERLVEFVAGLRHVSVEEIPRAILNEIERCSGEQRSDDIAILVLSLKSSESPA